MDSFRWLLVVLLALSLVLLGGVAAPVLAIDTTFTHNQNFDNYWHIPQNWDAGVPEGDDNAIIPGGQTCVIHNSQGNAKAMTLDLDGTLIVDKRNLTLGDQDSPYGATTSAISGLLKIDGGDYPADARLKISGVHTIVGEGGTIQLTFVPDPSFETGLRAIILEANDADDELILDHACSGDMSRDCGLSLTGIGDVRVRLDNGAFVVADVDAWDPVMLRLSHRPKTSNAQGYWICENGGTLSVETTVTGCGDWWVRDVNCTGDCDYPRGRGCSGTIVLFEEFDGCVFGSGDVVIQAGCGRYQNNDHQLKVEGTHTFCTTGRLLWQSVEGQQPGGTFISQPGIYVHPDAVASFGVNGTGCQTCD